MFGGWANFMGAVFLAGFVALSGLHQAGKGAVGRAAVDLAETKGAKDFATTMASGVLANLLVCLAVWLSYAAAGLEHSIANMWCGREKRRGSVAQRRRRQSVARNDREYPWGAFVVLTYHAAYGKTGRA